MDRNKAAAAFAALGQPIRIDVVRLLVRAGGEGVSSGDIGARLGMAGIRVPAPKVYETLDSGAVFPHPRTADATAVSPSRGGQDRRISMSSLVSSNPNRSS